MGIGGGGIGAAMGIIGAGRPFPAGIRSWQVVQSMFWRPSVWGALVPAKMAGPAAPTPPPMGRCMATRPMEAPSAVEVGSQPTSSKMNRRA